jgi:signal transduction histidine kinase
MRRHHGPRTLRSRLFSWFVGAILLAIGASALVVFTTKPEAITGAEAVAHNVSLHLASSWDDREATRAYVDEVRDVTGFEVRLVRDPRKVAPRVAFMAQRGAIIVPEGPDKMAVPVVRDGTLLGVLQMERFGPRPAPWAWWRFALALFLVVGILSIMAGRVANQLSRPLERLAEAADRFGGGDLAFRAEVAGRWRWVAREVRDVALSFNRMAERVEAMVRGQRELLGAISHELRSPLGRARVALEIARDRLPPDIESDARTPGTGAATNEAVVRTPRAAIDEVENQLGAVDAILGDLLDVTRAGLADLRKETRAFVEWLRARVAEELASSPAPPIELDASPGAAEASLAFDPALLARAVHNLLVNARTHGHPDAQPLIVRVTREGDRVRVAVRDRGPGFPPGFAQRAFEPFVRGDAARVRPSVGGGSGLGLAIVRRVVEAHGGSAFARNIESERSAGGAGAQPEGAETGFDLPLEPTLP